MTVSIVTQNSESITLQVTIPFNRSMLDSENNIQNAINELGTVATGELLKTFDTEGEDIQFGSVKMTSKGQLGKYYQTPYGAVNVERHVYQSAAGGATFCPLEKEARIILTSTPRFAAQVSYKMASVAAPHVKNDFSVTNNRNVSLSLVQDIAKAVASVVQVKEETWSYSVPNVEEARIKTVGIGLDGTCMLMCEGKYRQAMVGTISLYDAEGERRHTTYIAAAPEYGKEKFKLRLTREIERTKELYPQAVKIGIADGAPDNWSFLEQHTEKQTLDFYHATEYLTDVADAVFSSPALRKEWLDDRCHQLKYAPNAANNILTEIRGFKDNKISDPAFVSLEVAAKLASSDKNSVDPGISNTAEIIVLHKSTAGSEIENTPKDHSKSKQTSKKPAQKKKTLEAAITYFTNNNEKSRMNYWESVAANQVIGSGVTEAACKTIVKQRLCLSGMRWKAKGAGIILSLRTLAHSTGRWEQFWKKVNQYGFSLAA
jgi:hypothetical protein